MNSFVFRAVVSLWGGLLTAGEALSLEIEWEVANRFGPFVTQHPTAEGRAGLFDKYKIKDGESFKQWHKRLSDPQFHSPYLETLAAEDADAKTKGMMHWNQQTDRHAEAILKFVKEEESTDTLVDVRVRLDKDGQCQWSVSLDDAPTVPPSDCRTGTLVSIPLSGASVAVTSGDYSASEQVNPKHIVIVGFGDSYASGEGNPDYPGHWKDDVEFSSEKDFVWLAQQKNLKSTLEEHGETVKHWVDDDCHRSFFSHQSLLALKLASEKKDTFVSFLHYACTGAEIFDGLLVPQYQAWGKGIYIPYSQVNFAIQELCRSDVDAESYVSVSQADRLRREDKGEINLNDFHRRGGKGNNKKAPSNLAPGDKFSKRTSLHRKKNGGNFPNSGFLECPDGQIRVPDHVFLTIGGNDFGFADVVKYQIVPSRWKSKKLGSFMFPDVCPSGANRVSRTQFPQLTRHCEKKDKQNGYHAGDIVGEGKNGGIKDRLNLLTNIIENRLGVKPGQILMPQYPDSVRKVEATVGPCDPLDMQSFLKRIPGTDKYMVREEMLVGDPYGEYSPASSWNGLKSATPWLIRESLTGIARKNIENWEFNFTHEDAFLALREFEVLRPVLAESAKSLGINFVCSTRDVYYGYDFDQGSKRNLPNGVDGEEFPAWALTDWDPYVFEIPTRAVRTGNDTALSQPGDKQVTGAVHPNLTGHRLIAEEMFKLLPK